MAKGTPDTKSEISPEVLQQLNLLESGFYRISRKDWKKLQSTGRRSRKPITRPVSIGIKETTVTLIKVK